LKPIKTKSLKTSFPPLLLRLCIGLPVGRVSHCPLGLPQQKKTSLAVGLYVVQKITVIRAQIIGKFSVWNLILHRGAIWWRREKFEHGCTITYHPLQKNPKHFWKLHGLINFRCAQTLAYRALLVPSVRTCQFFVAPCNEVAKYFIRMDDYISTHKS